MDNLNPPRVLIESNVIGLNQSVGLDKFLTVTDLDADSVITKLQFRDDSVGGGSFVLNGQVLAANQFHEISFNQLSSLIYRGGSAVATESISVRVSDGLFWSNTGVGFITTGNSRPVLTAQDSSVAANGSLKIANLLDYSDADGDPDRLYLVVDRQIGINGGQLSLNGSLNPQGQWMVVRGADMPNLTYQGPTVEGGSEQLSIRVYDGYSWSEEQDFRIYANGQPQGPDSGPQEVLIDERRSATSLFQVLDIDHSSMISYLFVDRFQNADGGYWELDGVRQASAQWFSIAASQLDDLFYVGGDVAPQAENIGVITYDGFRFSPVGILESVDKQVRNHR